MHLSTNVHIDTHIQENSSPFHFHTTAWHGVVTKLCSQRSHCWHLAEHVLQTSQFSQAHAERYVVPGKDGSLDDMTKLPVQTWWAEDYPPLQPGQ